jgi:hypothetical protein
MRKSKTVPLARGLVGGETDSIYGQLEITLYNYKDVTISIRRKPYSGRSDISFSIPTTSLQSIIDVFYDAKEKLDDIWLSKVAVTELKASK